MLTQPQTDTLKQLISALCEDTRYHEAVVHTGDENAVADALAMLRVTRAKLDRMLSDLTLVRVEKKP